MRSVLPRRVPAMRHLKHVSRPVRLEDAFDALQVEGIDAFDQFARRTDGYWSVLARTLHERWVMPAGVEPADIKQELLLHAWQAALNYDPSRGVPMRTHVVWRAVHDARRWIHQQRNAKRRSCRAPSRCEYRLPEDGFEAEARVDDMVQVIDSKRRIEQQGGYARALLLATARAGGNVALAASRVFAEHPTLGCATERDACALIERAALVTFSD